MTWVLGTLAGLAPLLADYDGHHDMGGGWWVLMAIGMVLFWGLAILAAIWLVRELTGRGGRWSRGGRQSEALELLDRRLAEGSISAEEYRERRTILTDFDSSGSSPSG